MLPPGNTLHPIMLSRYQRPASPTTSLALTARDRRVLRAVYDHRYLTTEHLRLLVFPGISRRVVQARLRKLWEHRYLDRRFVPVVVGDSRHPGRPRGEPLYCLDGAGAIELSAELGIDSSQIPHTPARNAHGFATLEHHLVVTDLIVAISAACRDDPRVRLASFERETRLRFLIYQWRRTNGSGAAIVPDGAFTLEYDGGPRSTFYVEVVRAGVKGGNGTLGTKLRRYAELVRSGFFREAYGHGHVRAVLFVTTTPRRSEALRQVASHVRHGRQLFWFGAIAETAEAPSTLTPATILTKTWTTVDDRETSFISGE